MAVYAVWFVLSARVAIRGNCEWLLLAGQLVLQCCHGVGAGASTYVAMFVILISMTEDRTASQHVMLYMHRQIAANVFNS